MLLSSLVPAASLHLHSQTFPFYTFVHALTLTLKSSKAVFLFAFKKCFLKCNMFIIVSVCWSINMKLFSNNDPSYPTEWQGSAWHSSCTAPVPHSHLLEQAWSVSRTHSCSPPPVNPTSAQTDCGCPPPLSSMDLWDWGLGEGLESHETVPS